MKTYDIIILGCGGIGSATLYSAAKTGLKILGIEQYQRGHKNGGTHGETRAFRLAYYDNPKYIPLLKKAYSNWKQVEKHTNKKLYVETGILEIGLESGEMIVDALACAKEHEIPIEVLTKKQILSRFKGFHIPDEMIGIFQSQAGFLYVDECVNCLIDSAQNLGAAVNYNEKVISWHVDANQLVHILTDKNNYYSKKLIITAGSWAPELLSALNLPLTVLQKKLVWAPVNDSYSIDDKSPCFAYHLKNGMFYGFPSILNQIKIARHTGGTFLQDPYHKSKNMDDEEFLSIKNFISEHLTKVSSEVVKQENCLYDLTPDKQFIIDLHPEYPQIAFATGLSGHGYKMSNVIGDILVDLVTPKTLEFDISFLSLKRFHSTKFEI